ncbi:MAG TPA: glycosyltransferase family 39 protein [Pyrinomonadaceae bacterium]|nr:glycosyltransferase family 39 protein [Pyrinomonadaceae bacterium]
MARSIELSSDGVPGAGARVGGRRDAAALLERHAVVVLLVLAVLGFGLRASGLGRVGFAEDEINKLEAVRAYERGDITPNAEHPMVMKALIYVSVRAARGWNERAPASRHISDEAAVRLPNVLFGALTVFPVFLLTAAFFGRPTALLASALWAFGVSAVTYNRIAKEDTLLVFFMLLAFYFYLRAKQTSGFEAGRKKRFYVWSAISFGLMFASKYFPHYFGLNMLYHHLARVREREPGEPKGRTPRVFYLLLPVAFLLANPAVLLPETWDYLSAYSGERLLTHHGYLMGETLYDNVMSKTPFGGTPVYFYLLFLVTKTPVPVLLALAAGLFEVVRRRREPGPAFLLLMFVLWVVPYSLAGAKWLRYSLSLMPFVYMIAAVGVVALVQRLARAGGKETGGAAAREGSTRAGAVSPFSPAPDGSRALAAGALAVVVFVGLPAWSAYAARPHYALYTNALAPAAAGRFFPHDEFYDDGLREALGFVCREAPEGATVAHETPGVARYYLQRFGRTDLRSRVLSDPAFDPSRDDPARTFVILQRGRTYFENRDKMRAVRSGDSFAKAHEVFVRGVSAAEVYAPRR